MAKRKRRSSRPGSFNNVKRARLNKTAGIVSQLKYVDHFISNFNVELSDNVTAHVFLLSKV